MKTSFRIIASLLFASIASLAVAPSGAQAQPASAFSQQELEQMLAPIALYPDALLAQILMTSTYPQEVAEAARWSGERPGLSGDDAVRAAETEDWAPSVRSLVAFPQVLSRMRENLRWTQALGDAFLYQQTQVMGAVQDLRRRAQVAGSLNSDERWRVLDYGSGLAIEPLHSEVVYVPWYDPLVVYGTWWWPAYPPVQWRPWKVYLARPGYATGIYWAPPVRVSPEFFFGGIDWHRRQVHVINVASFGDRPGIAVNRAPIAKREPGMWRQVPDQRAGSAFRAVESQQRFNAASVPQVQVIRPRAPDGHRAHTSIEARPATQTEIRPAPPEVRPEHQRDARIPGPSAPPAAILRPAPTMQHVAHGVEHAPMLRPPPGAQPAPATPPAPRTHEGTRINRIESTRSPKLQR
ncbi:MAG: DUF3300 domain-containing protein [Betaproteobacteria bacterium]|nr:MAG: DUF3300 domain-containing protein [Betaproteobacteria bacterium]